MNSIFLYFTIVLNEFISLYTLIKFSLNYYKAQRFENIKLRIIIPLQTNAVNNNEKHDFLNKFFKEKPAGQQQTNNNNWCVGSINIIIIEWMFVENLWWWAITTNNF